MPGCSFRPPWRGTSACPNSSGSASTWAMPRGGRTRATCIDDADVLRTGGTACTLGGFTLKAPSGHLPAQLPVPQLDRVSRELLQPGDGPLTIDLDSTICETYGLAKEGARHHGYTGKRGYHPLLVAAGTKWCKSASSC